MLFIKAIVDLLNNPLKETRKLYHLQLDVHTMQKMDHLVSTMALPEKVKLKHLLQAESPSAEIMPADAVVTRRHMGISWLALMSILVIRLSLD